MNVTKNLIRGISWTLVQTFGTKMISLVTQLLLAWLLLPEIFGKASLVTSVTSITFLIQGLGIFDVLVSKGHLFNKIYDLAKSLVLLACISSFIITVTCAFIFGIYIFNDLEITYLILISSLAIPFNAMSIIADAKLRIDLKFRHISILRLSDFFLTNFLLVLLVVLKFGIYSFILAPVAASVSRYFLVHHFAHVNHRFHFSLNHYKLLLGNSIFSFLSNLSLTMTRHLDYLILGLFVTTQYVGIYYMGYSLSVQIIALLVLSLSPVFFPVLKKIPSHDQERLKTIIEKILIIFSMFGMCFSFLQASISQPVVELFLSDNWNETIEIIQILSIGIGFNISSTVWILAFTLKEDFKHLAIYSFYSLIFFLIIVTFFSFKFGMIGTAIAVALHNIIANSILLNISVYSYGISLSKIFSIVFKYFVFAGIIFSGFYLFSSKLQLSNFSKIFTSGILPIITYFVFIYLCDNQSKEILIETKTKVFGNAGK